VGECDEGILRGRVGWKIFVHPYLPRPGLLYCSSLALAGLSLPASGFEWGLRRPSRDLGGLLAGLPCLRPRL